MIVKIKSCLTRAAMRGAQRGAADAQHPRGSGGRWPPAGCGAEPRLSADSGDPHHAGAAIPRPFRAAGAPVL